MIRRISKYRDAIMGVAILWIMLHHSNLNIPNPLFAIKRMGYAGVDLFLFVSGLGCAVSLNKNNDILTFYGRRIKRLYPHYIPILIAFLAINFSGVTIGEWIRNILGNITGFCFWAMTGNQFNWYMLVITGFYILTPIFYLVIRRYKGTGLIILIILSFIAGYCYAPNSDLIIAVSRFPIYILGIAAGNKFVDGEDINTTGTSIVLTVLAGIIGFALLGLLYKYKNVIPSDFYNVFYPCILTSIFIMNMGCWLFERIDNTALGRAFVNGLRALGKKSLDLYLIHIVFFIVIDRLFEATYDNAHAYPFAARNIAIWIGIIAFVIVVSFIYGNAVDGISALIKNRKESSNGV